MLGVGVASLTMCAPFVVVGALIIGLMVVKVIMEYERGIVFTLGKYSGMLGPGVNFVIPIIQSVRKVDIRIQTTDIPKQEVMSRDNVPLGVNGVVYFRVDDPAKAILKIQDYQYAVAQYAQTALRDIVGGKEMDAVLSNRDEIADETKALVDKETEEWGIDVTAIKIQDIELPADMKRAMARQAEAERERRATIIMSEGEKGAAGNLAEAAARLAKTPGALHLRTLQTLSDVSADQSNTIVFVAPIEMLEALRGLMGSMKKKDAV